MVTTRYEWDKRTWGDDIMDKTNSVVIEKTNHFFYDLYISLRLACLVTSGNYGKTYANVMQLSVKIKKNLFAQNTENDAKPYLNISKSI